MHMPPALQASDKDNALAKKVTEKAWRIAQYHVRHITQDAPEVAEAFEYLLGKHEEKNKAAKGAAAAVAAEAVAVTAAARTAALGMGAAGTCLSAPSAAVSGGDVGGASGA